MGTSSTNGAAEIIQWQTPGEDGLSASIAWIGPQRWFFWLDQPPEQVARARKHIAKHGPLATFPRLKGATAVSPRSFERVTWYEEDGIIDIEGGGRPVLKSSPPPVSAFSLEGLPADVGETLFQTAQVTSGLQPTRPPAPKREGPNFDPAALWENAKGYLSTAAIAAAIGVVMFLCATGVIGDSERTALTRRGRKNQAFMDFINWISDLLGPIVIVVLFGGIVVGTLAWAVFQVVPRRGPRQEAPAVQFLERPGVA